MKKVIIDTDPGINDAAALLLALASPELSVVAIATGTGMALLRLPPKTRTEDITFRKSYRCAHLCRSL